MIETTARFQTFQRLLKPTKGIELNANLDGREGRCIALRMSYQPDDEWVKLSDDQKAKYGVLRVCETVKGEEERVLFSIDILGEIESRGYDKESTAWKSSDQGARVTIVFEDINSQQEAKSTVSNDNMSKDVKISVPKISVPNNLLEIQMRKKLKKVLKTSQVIYTSEKARIINIPYKSDLEPWLKENGGGLERFFEGQPVASKSADGASGKKEAQASSSSNGKKSEDKDMLKRIQKFLFRGAKSAKAEAQCTLHTCANIHPWSVRGTLHPWKTYQDGEANLDLHTGECQICDGYGGKDGGLFTGETLLHIAIVQHDHQMVKWLLDGGASLDVRALGVFFQRPRIDRFTSDQTSFPFTLWPKEQQADNNNFFRYLFQCLNRNTWT